jgi:predicted acetyltransferase
MSFSYIDPGLLIDGDLELVAPDETGLNALMAAQRHPLTRRDMPLDAAASREFHLQALGRLVRGYDGGDASHHRVPHYSFWMRRRSVADLPIAGGITLRLGHGPNIERVVGHVGYHVYPFARGHHYAERACRLLLPLARAHGLNPLWITCNPDNPASRRTCQRLDAALIDIVPIPQDHPLYARGEREKCRYRLSP